MAALTISSALAEAEAEAGAAHSTGDHIRPDDAAVSTVTSLPGPSRPLSSAHPLYHEVTVRVLRRDEIPAACEMLVNEWPSIPSLDFHYALYDAYPSGWLCATVGDSILGISFFATFPDGSGFGGYLLVKEEHRGKGVGKRLHDTCLALFANSNYAIDAMEDRVESYKKSGYSIVSFRILSFCGAVDFASAVTRLSDIKRERQAPSTSDDRTAVELQEVRQPPEDLLRYDAEVNAARRDSLVKLYTALPESYTLVARSTLDGTVVGYGTLHRGVECYQISPLYADDPDIAELIFLSLVERMPTGDEELCLTTPEPNAAAVRLAERVALPLDYATVRMYTKSEIPLPLHKVYSIATEDASFA